jgi:FkbM family methyltransferase
LVIDVGANLGQTIDLVISINPACKIFAFEPNPSLFEKLKTKYSLKKNIHLFQLGISEEKGTKIFHENILHSTSTLEDINFSSEYLKRKSSILGVKPEEILKKSYSINVTTLSDFISQYCPLEKINLIKIDTEGHEYHCLKGLFKNASSNIDFIQLENHKDDMYMDSESFDRILELLQKNRFELVKTIPHSFGSFNEVIFKGVN